MTTASNIQFSTTEQVHELPTIADAQWPPLNGHRCAWFAAIKLGLRHSVFIVEARQGNQVVGILPLCLLKGPLFGRFLVSLPYINTGGVWAKDEIIAQGLIDQACDLADKHDVKYLELRHEEPVNHERFNHERDDKVHMRLALPATSDELLASFKSKLRSQIKKSSQYGLKVRFGGKELLKQFYHVFSVNMRDLGTPVFSRKLFIHVLDQFNDEAEFCVVESDSAPAAAGLLVHSHGTTEVPSASCLRSFNRKNANMFMYWNLLQRAIEKGSGTFDFGRSSKGSGTYKFKSQWGATPHPATWQYYVRKGNPADMRPDSDTNQRLIRIWKMLPVWATRLVGPAIVRGIP